MDPVQPNTRVHPFALSNHIFHPHRWHWHSTKWSKEGGNGFAISICQFGANNDAQKCAVKIGKKFFNLFLIYF